MSHAITALRFHGKEVEDEHAAVNEPAQRHMYGGLNLGAAFFGWLVSTGMAAIITSLLAGAGAAVAFSPVQHVTVQGVVHSAVTIGLVGGILLLVALAISYLAGGYVAGRMSRFDGVRQGIGVWIIGIIVTVILGGVGALFGARYNALQQINLPHIPISQGTFSTAGYVAFAAILIVTLVAAIIGGKLGERYHRKIDRAGTV